MARRRVARVGDFSVEIDGLDDTIRRLRRAQPEIPKAIKAAGKEAAGIVSDEAKRQARRQGRVVRFASETVRPFATQRKTGVRLGGTRGRSKRGRRNAVAFGAETGSKRYRQFPSYLGGLDRGGYIVRPAIDRKAKEMRDAFIDATQDAMRDAFRKGI